MSATVLAKLIAIFLFGLLGVFIVFGIFSSTTNTETVGIALGMELVGYMMLMAGYLFEARKAKEFLLDITRGTIINNPF